MEAILDEILIQQLTAQLSAQDRDIFRQRVDQLSSLPDQDTELGDFLARFVDSVAKLYAASAVAIWFRNPDQSHLVRQVDVGWANLALDQEAEVAHQLLVQHAVTQVQPLSVQPFSSPRVEAGVSNPTDSLLLFAPVYRQHEAIAVIELALGPKPLRRPQRDLVKHYLEWLRWLTAVFYRGLEQRFVAARQPLAIALACLDQATQQVEAIQEQIRLRIQQSLRRLVGQNFGSLIANQTVAKRVHALLDSKGLRVRCPECGAASILRCQNAGNSKTGVFVFDHYLDSGRTFHGGPTTFPPLEVVPKPPRRKKTSG